MTKTLNTVLDLNPSLTSLQKDVVRGLRQTKKQIHPKFFYDDKGSHLFNQITALSEYYLTRAEKEILTRYHHEISKYIGNDSTLIELGCGNEEKIKLILENFTSKKRYMPIDISKEALDKTVAKITGVFPLVDVKGIRADYTQALTFLSHALDSKKMILFLGSTIGNFEEQDRDQFLKALAKQLNAEDGLFIGVDLRKSTTVLEAAYNDSLGVTAAFNKNLLHRINRELSANFQVDQYDHDAFFNQAESRIEMHLVSKTYQEVTIGKETFSFLPNETIHTENSYKFDLNDLEENINKAGLTIKETWFDNNNYFALTYIKTLKG